MKKYDEYEEQLVYKKRPKHSKNRPGEGMRVLNTYVELDYDEDVDIDDEEFYNYDTNAKNDRTR